jgi:hypothetical protein
VPSGWNIFQVGGMTFVVGKRCKPILLYAIVVIVALSLVYFYVHHGGGGGLLPENPPMH